MRDYPTFAASLLAAAVGVSAAPLPAAAPSFTQLESLIATAETNPQIPGGSVRVVDDRATVFDHYFGTLSTQSETPWDDQTVVAIASISKSITATLVAVIVGEGTLHFEDPIATYLPEYAELRLSESGRPIRSPTIAECLSHTSGLPGGTISSLPADSPVHRGDQAAVASYFAAQGLATPPGTKYAYSFRGFAAVSRVIEVATGRLFAEVLQEKLLVPLGMNETTFTPDVSLARRIPAYAPYTAGRDDRQVATQIKRELSRRGAFVNAAGALFSTPDDLQRFLQFHADQGSIGDHAIVPAAILTQLYAPQPASPKYGLGFALHEGSVVGHGGATGTSVSVDLTTGRLLIVLTQAGAKNARPLTAGATRLVFPSL
jgi:CubicO group peptidase (beta-lactamase class C family)